MKFDVVIGNPPYQSGKGNGSQPIYKDFVKKFMELSVRGGMVAAIAPPDYLCGGNLNQPTELLQRIKNGNLLVVNLDDVGNYFPKIGSLFSYMLWQNSEYEGITKINNHFVDISDMNIIPPKFTPLVWSIIKKITNGEKLATTYRKQCDLSKWVVAFKELNHVSDKKGNIKATVFPPGEYSIKWNFAKECDSEKEAINLANYLNGKLVSFFNYVIRHNRVIHNGIIGNLSVPDVHCKSSHEQYKYFGLTQEEIDYIEATVK